MISYLSKSKSKSKCYPSYCTDWAVPLGELPVPVAHTITPGRCRPQACRVPT